MPHSIPKGLTRVHVLKAMADLDAGVDHPSGKDMIEVNTTTTEKCFPFLVTSNEVWCSESMAAYYHLYRLLHFSHPPHQYVLHGALSSLCRLDLVAYRATVIGKEAAHDA